MKSTFLTSTFVAIFLILGFFFVMQERFIFFPEQLPQDYDLQLSDGAEEVFFSTDDGARINAIWYRQDDAPGVILYLHGNAGSLRTWQLLAPTILSTGYDLFMIDYRTFGKSRGKLSEDGLYADGLGAYQALLDRGYSPDQIVVLGRSIGTGIATKLAATQPTAALILETPFTNLMDLALQHMPILPRLLLTYRFENDARAASIDVPTLILHGDRDEIIPLAMGQSLYEEFSPPRHFLLLPGASHNNIDSHPDYLPGLIEFLSEL